MVVEGEWEGGGWALSCPLTSLSAIASVAPLFLHVQIHLRLFPFFFSVSSSAASSVHRPAVGLFDP